jgi:hypothetical protein
MLAKHVRLSVSCELMFGIFAESYASDGSFSARVDVYNASSNSWASFPTGLGQARGSLAAASLPSGLVFFAGGEISGDQGFLLFQLVTLAQQIYYFTL